MKKYHVSFVLLLTLTVVSCKKIKYYEPPQAEVILDVAYGTDPMQTMDVYLPENRDANTNVIVLLHGGAFVAGDKDDFTAHSIALQQAGYAVLNVNYRLVDGSGLIAPPYASKLSAIKVTNQLDDIKKAVDFAVGESAKYQVRKTKWAMAGHSAGGTLSLLYAYGSKNSDGQIKAVANWAGVTDFSYEDEMMFTLLDPRLKELFYRLVGKMPTNANKDDFKAISPIWTVTATTGVPTMNIRPENNSVFGLPDFSEVQYQQFTQKLNTLNVLNQFELRAGVDHGFSGQWEPVMLATVTYFDAKLK